MKKGPAFPLPELSVHEANNHRLATRPQNWDSILPSPDPWNHHIKQVCPCPETPLTFSLSSAFLLPDWRPQGSLLWLSMLPPNLNSFFQYSSFQGHPPHSCLSDGWKCKSNSIVPGFCPSGSLSLVRRHHALLAWPCPLVRPHLLPFLVLSQK